MNIQDDRGFTLLETVVAMALFVSVLLPLGVIVGNLILDGSAKQMNLALHVAETEMQHVITQSDFAGGIWKDNSGMMINRHVERNQNLVDIIITVLSTKEPKKSVLTLHKSVVEY